MACTTCSTGPAVPGKGNKGTKHGNRREHSARSRPSLFKMRGSQLESGGKLDVRLVEFYGTTIFFWGCVMTGQSVTNQKMY
jgi:hypothetical protein